MLQRIRQFASIGLLLIVAMIMAAPSARAEEATIQITINGIECDLDAIYGNNDPATVVVPSYCSNAPQPEVPPVVPAPEQPNTPSPVPLNTPAFQPRISIEPLLYSSPAPQTSARIVQPVDSYRASETFAILALVVFFVVVIVLAFFSRRRER